MSTLSRVSQPTIAVCKLLQNNFGFRSILSWSCL